MLNDVTDKLCVALCLLMCIPALTLKNDADEEKTVATIEFTWSHCHHWDKIDVFSQFAKRLAIHKTDALFIRNGKKRTVRKWFLNLTPLYSPIT